MTDDLLERLENAIDALKVDDESCAPSNFADVCAAANCCRDIRIAWGLGECLATDLLFNLLVERTEWMLTTYQPQTVLDGRNNGGIVASWRAVWELWRKRDAATEEMDVE